MQYQFYDKCLWDQKGRQRDCYKNQRIQLIGSFFAFIPWMQQTMDSKMYLRLMRKLFCQFENYQSSAVKTGVFHLNITISNSKDPAPSVPRFSCLSHLVGLLPGENAQLLTDIYFQMFPYLLVLWCSPMTQIWGRWKDQITQLDFSAWSFDVLTEHFKLKDHFYN